MKGGSCTGPGKLTTHNKVLKSLRRIVIRSGWCFSLWLPSARLWVLWVMRLHHTPFYISDRIQQRALNAMIWCSINGDWTCGKDASDIILHWEVNDDLVQWILVSPNQETPLESPVFSPRLCRWKRRGGTLCFELKCFRLYCFSMRERVLSDPFAWIRIMRITSWPQSQLQNSLIIILMIGASRDLKWIVSP